MTGPRRIQRKRTKGWRMPARAVYVGRPTRWGNPFPIGKPSGVFDGQDGRALGLCGEPEILIDRLSPEKAVELYRTWLLGITTPEMYPYGHREVSPCRGYPAKDFIRQQLAGKDLVCWCPPDMPCHADVLLEIANEGTEK